MVKQSITRLPHSIKNFSFFHIIASIITLIVFYPAWSFSASVKLAWSKNNELNLAGYRLFCREDARNYNYAQPLYDGPNTSFQATGLNADNTYHYTVRAYTTSGLESKDSNEVTFTVPASTSGTTDNVDIVNTSSDTGQTQTDQPGTAVSFEVGPDRIISIEAENYSKNNTGGSHSWTPVYPAGSSDTIALQALPDINKNFDSDFVTKSCRLDYQIRFNETGTYFIWIRGRASSDTNDSLHAGLNGSAQNTSDRINGFKPDWRWSGSTMDGAPASISINQTGVNTLNIWMREDGIIIDKIILSKSGSYQPEGFGPAETQLADNAEPSADSEADSNLPENNTTPEVPTGDTPSHFQVNGKDGLLSIEAENFDQNALGKAHNWEFIYPAGSSESIAMQALPDINQNYNTNYVTKSCRLDYRVHFQNTGTHYIWIRGKATSDTNDSLHVGLDNRAISTSDRINGFHSDWIWSRSTMDGNAASLFISQAGDHTLNIWMREDGMILDKIVLTTSAGYQPYGIGPPESIENPDQLRSIQSITKNGTFPSSDSNASEPGAINPERNTILSNSDTKKPVEDAAEKATVQPASPENETPAPESVNRSARVDAQSESQGACFVSLVNQ